MENLVEYISYLSIIVALICTLTSIVTEITKEIGVLKMIPTAAQVTTTSILITTLTFVSYASIKALTIKWYYIFASVVCGIFIAYITMYGWDKLIARFKEFYKKDLK